MNQQELAIKSAEIYLKYATDQGRSCAQHSLSSIRKENGIFELTLYKPLPHTEGLLLRIGETDYDEEMIQLADYEPESRTLRAIPKNEILEKKLENTPADQIFIISDLRFLIKRVWDWYRTFGSRITMPQKAPSLVRYRPKNLSKIPSADQEKAIDGILSEPFAYVWGAPGTGKTQVVLARCLLNYIKKGKRVLIAAPTNRAVEQILYGIMPILREMAIKDATVLRLGIPTKEFAAKYPEICENQMLLQKLAELEHQIAETKNKLEETTQKMHQYERFRRFLQAQEKIEQSKQKLTPALSDYVATEKQLNSLKDHLTLLSMDQQKWETRRKEAAEQMHLLSAEIARTKLSLARKNNSFFRSLLKKQIEQQTAGLQLAESALKELEGQKQLYEAEWKSIYDEKAQKLREQKAACAKKESLNALFSSAITELTTLCRVPQQNGSLRERAHAVLKYAEAFIKERAKNYEGFDLAEAQQLLLTSRRLEEELQKMIGEQAALKTQHSIRMDKCLVIAATIDTCLVKVQPNGDFKPSHVFLDEAGYAPLIKAATLTAYDCPLTLLGDHMQLPPVCEINDERLKREEYAPVVLWAQSAIHLEEFFTAPFETLHRRYLEHKLPYFDRLRKYDLTHSYRFGENLASILAGSVYADALEGSNEQHTKILYIHAPRKAPTESPSGTNMKRISEAECAAITRFVRAHDDLEIGVITPYRNQRSALQRMLPEHIEVNTVHGSQGREWECVVLSVVDTTDKYFTNSLSPVSNGKNIINTAVSRAKNFLVIVCDAHYWKSQQNQLLGKLLNIAEELKL